MERWRIFIEDAQTDRKRKAKMFEHLFTCKHPTSDSDAYGNAYEINFNFHFKLWFFALSATLLGNNMNSTHFPANFYSLLIPSCSLNAFHRVFAAFTGSCPMHLLSLLSLFANPQCSSASGLPSTAHLPYRRPPCALRTQAVKVHTHKV